MCLCVCACGLGAVEPGQDKAAGGAEYVSPDAIPWKALRAILSESVYGGKIDNAFDSNLLSYVATRTISCLSHMHTHTSVSVCLLSPPCFAVLHSPIVVWLPHAGRTMLSQVFVPESFKVDFSLIRIPGSGGGEGTDVRAPEPSVTSHDAVVAWVDSLPHSPPPTWLGLSATADNRLLMQKVRGLRARLRGTTGGCAICV